MGRLALAIAMVLATPSGAEPLTYALPEETATLRPGPNWEAAQNNCLACHSVDYILLQPPHMGRPYWEGVVKKMIKIYRAPIDEDEAQKIVDYLATTY